MPRGSLDSIAADDAFPALAFAADPAYLLARIAESLGVEESSLSLNGVEVLNHKPGRRCTIAYEVEDASGVRRLTGKWYRDTDDARRAHANLVALTEEPGALMLPPALSVNDDGLVLQGFVEGRELRDLAPEGDGWPFAVAGAWLARLHAADQPAGIETKTRAHELKKIQGWLATVSAALPPLAADLATTGVRLRSLSAGLEEAPDVVIHRDYYAANLIWDGERAWGIDLDQLALGDAAVDLGSFVAQLEKMALRSTGSLVSYDALARNFLDAYRRAGGRDAGPRVQFFVAYTHLKLAAAEVERRRPDWREVATAFANRAGEATDNCWAAVV